MELAQDWKKLADEWEDKVKINEEHLKKLESEKREREQYESELGVVLWNSVNTMQADLDTHTRLVQCLSPCMSTYSVCTVGQWWVGTLVKVYSLLNFASIICEGRGGQLFLISCKSV